MTLGEKIKDARMRCGLSQAQLADKLCVSRSAIAKWETDKGLPDIGNLKLLSRLLCVSVDQLLDDGETDERPVIREYFQLSAYGTGCKRIMKDRVIRDKYPEARICALLGRRELPPIAYTKQGVLSCSHSKDIGHRSILRDPDKAFYLVEQSGKHFLVTVTDEFMESRLLEQPPDKNSFSLGGWNFVKCNYEIT